ncbi:MAG: PepSY domain-containing protein [Thermoleophilaceae bacterium]
MSRSIRKTIAAVAALAALALGAGALADAASNGGSSSSSGAGSSSAQQRQAPPVGPHGRHVGRNGNEEQPLSGDVASKVKAAAEAKVSGGTVERVETDVDHGSPYEAHVRKSDGTDLEVLVNRDFEVTAVNTMGPGGPGGPGGPPPSQQ